VTALCPMEPEAAVGFVVGVGDGAGIVPADAEVSPAVRPSRSRAMTARAVDTRTGVAPRFRARIGEPYTHHLQVKRTAWLERGGLCGWKPAVPVLARTRFLHLRVGDFSVPRRLGSRGAVARRDLVFGVLAVGTELLVLP